MSKSMFTPIAEIKSTMTMEVLVGPRPYKKIIVDAIPVGIDRGHHCHGALIYKITNSDDLVMYDDNCFYRLHGAQYDDIETPDGMQFCFADDGEYGICNFAIPEEIRRRNVFIKSLGVIKWEESLNYEWFEEDRRNPRVYQWNPRTNYVREVYHNGTFSGWHDYIIENNYRAKLLIDDLFDDKYAGLIEWSLAQTDDPEDDYADIAQRYDREWNEYWEAVGREEDEFEQRYAHWEELRQWAMLQDTSEYPEEWCIETNRRFSEKSMEARRIMKFIDSDEFTDVNNAWMLFDIVKDDFYAHKVFFEEGKRTSMSVNMYNGLLDISSHCGFYIYLNSSRKWYKGVDFYNIHYDGTPSKEVYEKITTIISSALRDKYSMYV